MPATRTRVRFSPGRPAALLPGADRGAPADQEQDVEHHEDREDRLAVLPPRGDLGLVAVVDAHVQGRAQGQGGGGQDGEEDREELVDAAAAAPELVEAVEVEDRRPEQRHQGQEQEVAREGGDALGDRDDPADRVGLEPQEVGEEPGERRWPPRRPRRGAPPAFASGTSASGVPVGQRPLDERAHALLEDLTAVRLGPGSKRESIKAGRFEGRNGGAQRLGGGRRGTRDRCGRARSSPRRPPRRRRWRAGRRRALRRGRSRRPPPRA